MEGQRAAGGGEVVVYEAPDGEVRVDVRLEQETVSLSQEQTADLFDTSTDNVGLHLKNVYAEGELSEGATTEESSVVQTEGRRRVRRQVKHYNLDAILSVGYRVSTKRGTQFRIWATRTLRERLVRGVPAAAARREYLRRNGLLLRTDGNPRLADNAVVALSLLVAESEPAQKDLVIRLILNLLEDETP
jgi:hypothetical protein